MQILIPKITKVWGNYKGIYSARFIFPPAAKYFILYPPMFPYGGIKNGKVFLLLPTGQ